MASAGGGAGSGQAGGYGQAGGNTAAGGGTSTGTAAPATQSPQNLNQIVRLHSHSHASPLHLRSPTTMSSLLLFDVVSSMVVDMGCPRYSVPGLEVIVIASWALHPEL